MGASRVAYQLWHEVLACLSILAEARDRLTSDKLEGLRDHLIATALVVLGVGHDCGCVLCVCGVVVAAMAGSGGTVTK
jgi:hypothetical protein